MADKNLSEQLMIAQEEKAALVEAVSVANTALLLQLEEKSQRAAELIVANIELDFQKFEKEKRAAELKLANIELDFQNLEKEKRADELIIANTELLFQNREKEKRADELVLANKELIYQNQEKGKRAAELVIANDELVYNNKKLISTNDELTTAKYNLQQSIQNHTESEDRFLSMAENSGILISIFDESKGAIYFSKAWVEFTGRTMEDLLKFGWVDLIHPEDRDSFVNIYFAAFEKRLPFTGEFRMLNKDGDYRWLLAKGTPRLSADGTFAGYIRSSVDITELKLEALRKNDFIGMASHELKTPLTSLTAIIQILQAKLKNHQDSFVGGALDKANIQVKKMSAMINGFLNISRFESGKITINKQIFNLVDLLTEMIDETKLIITKHTINFERNLAVQIQADRDKIGSVITNLLSNAIKYSPNGKLIEVKYRIKEDSVEVSFKDEGSGVNLQDKEKLFDRYYRVENDQTKYIAGFGIGLYLSAEIIKRHNGAIWVESNGILGSTFFFSLPLNAVIDAYHSTLKAVA
jgi:PAS domain S-box-containing protein